MHRARPIVIANHNGDSKRNAMQQYLPLGYVALLISILMGGAYSVGLLKSSIDSHFSALDQTNVEELRRLDGIDQIIKEGKAARDAQIADLKILVISAKDAQNKSADAFAVLTAIVASDHDFAIKQVDSLKALVYTMNNQITVLQCQVKKTC